MSARTPRRAAAITASTTTTSRTPGRSKSPAPKTPVRVSIAIESDDEDLAEMTVVELKRELTKRGAPTTGKKAILINRLKEVKAETIGAGHSEDDKENSPGPVFMTPATSAPTPFLGRTSSALLATPLFSATPSASRTPAPQSGAATPLVPAATPTPPLQTVVSPPPAAPPAALSDMRVLRVKFPGSSAVETILFDVQEKIAQDAVNQSLRNLLKVKLDKEGMDCETAYLTDSTSGEIFPLTTSFLSQLPTPADPSTTFYTVRIDRKLPEQLDRFETPFVHYWSPIVFTAIELILVLCVGHLLGVNLVFGIPTLHPVNLYDDVLRGTLELSRLPAIVGLFLYFVSWCVASAYTSRVHRFSLRWTWPRIVAIRADLSAEWSHFKTGALKALKDSLSWFVFGSERATAESSPPWPLRLRLGNTRVAWIYHVVKFGYERVMESLAEGFFAEACVAVLIGRTLLSDHSLVVAILLLLVAIRPSVATLMRMQRGEIDVVHAVRSAYTQISAILRVYPTMETQLSGPTGIKLVGASDTALKIKFNAVPDAMVHIGELVVALPAVRYTVEARPGSGGTWQPVGRVGAPPKSWFAHSIWSYPVKRLPDLFFGVSLGYLTLTSFSNPALFTVCSWLALSSLILDSRVSRGSHPAGPAACTVSNLKLPGDHSYEFRVVAIDALGREGVYSGETLKAKTRAPPPPRRCLAVYGSKTGNYFTGFTHLNGPIDDKDADVFLRTMRAALLPREGDQAPRKTPNPSKVTEPDVIFSLAAKKSEHLVVTPSYLRQLVNVPVSRNTRWDRIVSGWYAPLLVVHAPGTRHDLAAPDVYKYTFFSKANTDRLVILFVVGFLASLFANYREDVSTLDWMRGPYAEASRTIVQTVLLGNLMAAYGSVWANAMHKRLQNLLGSYVQQGIAEVQGVVVRAERALEPSLDTPIRGLVRGSAILPPIVASLVWIAFNLPVFMVLGPLRSYVWGIALISAWLVKIAVIPRATPVPAIAARE